METNAELAVIGSILLDPGLGFEVIDRLRIKPEYLRQTDNRIMLKELLKMRDQGDPIEPGSLSMAMPQKYKEAPWRAIEEPITAEAAEFWAEKVLEASILSELRIANEEFSNALDNPESDLEKAKDKLKAAITETDNRGKLPRIKTLSEVARAEVIDQLDHPPSYIPTPWEPLNEVIGGLRPGGFYIVAARPGEGKSLFGLQLAQGIATPETQVAFIGFEMQNREQAIRALASRTLIDTQKIDRKTLTEEEKRRLALAYKELSNDLHLIDNSSKKVTELRPVIRSLNINTGGRLKALVIDYLGLMEAEGGNKYEVVTRISGQLKSLANELDIPIVALAQLNRNSAKEKRFPGLQDLRDSGAIEQDADVVIVLGEDRTDHRLMVLKNRQGTLGAFTGKMQGETMRLLDLVRAW